MKPAGKLLKLKEWLTLDEAASYLSALLEEEVKRVDILRLALDGHLKLSVNFVNHVRAIKGVIVPTKSIPFRKLLDPENQFGLADVATQAGIKISDCESILLQYEQNSENTLHYNEPEVLTMLGVWELTMIGGESLDAVHEYQMLSGGAEVTLTTLDGCFVRSPSDDKAVYQIQEHFSNNEYYEKKNLHKNYHHHSNYFPAGGLPDDCDLVVSTKALQAFEQSLSTPKQREQSEKACKNEPLNSTNLVAWLRKENLEWDKINRKLDQPTGISMFDFFLKQYFEYENWKLSEALLLLAGITPKATLVDWNYVEETHEGAPLARFKIDVLSPIKFVSVCEHPLEKFKEGEHGFDGNGIKNWNQEAEKHAFVIRHYKNKLETIADLWERSAHPDSNLNNLTLTDSEHRNRLVSKEYIISWALSKGLEIIWLDWAKNRNLINQNNDKDESNWATLSPPNNSGEFASLCYQVANTLRRIPKREVLARELVRQFGTTHNITVSDRTGISLNYGDKTVTHNVLNKNIKKISDQLNDQPAAI